MACFWIYIYKSQSMCHTHTHMCTLTHDGQQMCVAELMGSSAALPRPKTHSTRALVSGAPENYFRTAHLSFVQVPTKHTFTHQIYTSKMPDNLNTNLLSLYAMFDIEPGETFFGCGLVWWRIWTMVNFCCVKKHKHSICFFNYWTRFDWIWYFWIHKQSSTIGTTTSILQ